MNGTKKLTLAMLLALGAGNALALGLGQIKVESGLHEPLRAVIPVLSDDPAELRNLKVALASRDEFERAGLSFSRLDVPLEFTVVKQPDGDTVIEITTDEPVDEPAVGFLLAVNWANGKLLREYSVLLDPPHIAPITTSRPSQVAEAAPVPQAPAPAPVESPEVAPAQTVAQEQEPELPAAEPETSTSPAVAATPAAAPQPIAAVSSIGDSYSVTEGDTLWEIASRVQAGTGVGINRAMIAIQRANPEAFYRDNINVLKKGAVLRIPGRDALLEVSAAEAQAAVAAQHAAWVGREAEQPTLVARSGDAAASTGATAPGAGDRLELAAPGAEGGGSESRAGDQSGSGNAVVADLRQDLARSNEALASEQQKTDELTARVESLEDLQKKSGSLLELKNTEIAQLQQQLAAAREAAASASAPAPATAAAASTVAAPLAAASTVLEEDIFAANEEPAVNATVAANAATAAAPALAASTAAVAADIAPAGSATVTTAALDQQPVAERVDVADTEAQQPLPEAEPQIAPQPAPAEPWYMQTWAWIAGGVALLLILLGAWWSRRRGAGHSGDSDASIADQFSDDTSDEGTLTDVGDDEYALIEELEQHPDDLALHLELASLYYAMRDQNKFEDAAEAMYGHVDDPDQAEWQQVRAMGEELCPDHPLFADLHTDSSEQFEQTEEKAPPFEDAAASEPDDGIATSEDKEPGYNYDFDLTPGARGTTASESAQEADEFASSPADDSDLTSEPARTSEDPSLAELAGAEDESADESGFGSDPIDTKLDLARAYQDMGDEEGARAMLEEVIAEGSEAQKGTARQLLKDL